MKRILLITIVACLSVNISFAQLPNGSVAPDFTLVDLNGTSHNLYSYLDSGYTVFIDFSAVWCPPCWSYHNSGALEDLYINHGPSGMPNVSANTTDDVMVFFIEGDEGSLADLNGTGSNTQGDWVTGTPYPIIPTYAGSNSAQVSSNYQIGYWPTCYMICPDRLTSEPQQPSNPYSLINACPPTASNNDDARTFNYAGETVTCEGDLTPEIMIQNYGIANLTSLSIEVKVNGTSQSITPWTGNLSTYATNNITLPTLVGLSNNDAVTIDASLPNGVADQDPSNNPTISFNATLSTQNTHTNVTVNITTDAYGSETTWDLKNSTGQTIASGGPYNDLTASGTTPQTPVPAMLLSQECHAFTIYDSYGDGMDAGYGAGSFSVVDGNGTTLVSGGVFTDEDGGGFKTGNATAPSWDCDAQGNCSDPGTGNGQYTSLASCNTACNITSINNHDSESFSIYPNPVKDILNVQGKMESVEIFDVFGKLVLTSTNNIINTSDLAEGIYVVSINTNNIIITKRITVTK